MSLETTYAAINAAEKRAGLPENSVQLVAVSKLQTTKRVEATLAAGHRLFGENRVQEAMERWPPLMERHGDISLHMVGPLQTNKVRHALRLFDAIHSVDRVSLADRLARGIQALGQAPELFVQVNTGEEPQKSGIVPAEADEFIRYCRGVDLPVSGLMVIPPAWEEPSLHFALLGKIARRNGLKNLSMGMSNDFETAIAFGATHVRVGSAVFGERLYR